jgi:hypothetical protein
MRGLGRRQCRKLPESDDFDTAAGCARAGAGRTAFF